MGEPKLCGRTHEAFLRHQRWERFFIQSDGTPWRPLVHVEDICRGFLAVLDAPRGLVHNQAFNVGNSDENYRIRDVAEIVREVVPGAWSSTPSVVAPTSADRVDCGKIPSTLPAFEPQWTVRLGVEQLYAAYCRYGLTEKKFLGTKYLRIKRIRKLQSEGRLDRSLRWRVGVPVAVND